jgi:hypothetical protein
MLVKKTKENEEIIIVDSVVPADARPPPLNLPNFNSKTTNPSPHKSTLTLSNSNAMQFPSINHHHFVMESNRPRFRGSEAPPRRQW